MDIIHQIRSNYLKILSTPTIMKKYRLFFLIIYCLISTSVTIAQPVLYPAPEGLSPSAEYSVKINGKDAFVYASPVPAAYCSFDINGAVEITIKANRDIKWVDVRPLALGIKPIFKDSTIHFKLSKPAQISIELNGSINAVVHFCQYTRKK